MIFGSVSYAIMSSFHVQALADTKTGFGNIDVRKAAIQLVLVRRGKLCGFLFVYRRYLQTVCFGVCLAFYIWDSPPFRTLWATATRSYAALVARRSAEWRRLWVKAGSSPKWHSSVLTSKFASNMLSSSKVTLLSIILCAHHCNFAWKATTVLCCVADVG